jgi:hypothetical protein
MGAGGSYIRENIKEALEVLSYDNSSIVVIIEREIFEKQVEKDKLKVVYGSVFYRDLNNIVIETGLLNLLFLEYDNEYWFEELTTSSYTENYVTKKKTFKQHENINKIETYIKNINSRNIINDLIFLIKNLS